MIDIDAQFEYWDRVGLTKPFSHSLALDRLQSWLALDARVVDIGCGYGRNIAVLADAGFVRLLGVEPAQTMAVAARARCPRVPIVLGDARRLPLCDHCADAVLLFAVLTCIPTDEGQRAALAETRRLLQPGGILCVSDFCLQTDPRNVERYERGVRRFGRYGVFELTEGVILRHHDRAWLDELTGEFSTVERRELEVSTMNGHVALGFQWVGRLK
jgi:SAM-dependent methyltransferase